MSEKKKGIGDLAGDLRDPEKVEVGNAQRNKYSDVFYLNSP